MNIKDYLSQALKLDKLINCKLEQVTALRNLSEKVTVKMNNERIIMTKQRSPMEDALVKLIDLENEINMDIDIFVDIKREISTFISCIENPSYKLLLELRYLGGNSWENVAEIMGYDLRWVYRLHERALRDAEILLNKQL